MLTLETARKLLDYDRETGVFRWSAGANVGRGTGKRRPGERAGYINDEGYLYIETGGKAYRANRLAWFYVYGIWPANLVDHINGDKTDNRIDNLRDVPHSVNKQNIKHARRDSASGLPGVYQVGGRWKATISVGGKRMYLGRHPSAEGAHQAYLAAKRKFHEGCTI